MPAHVSDRYDFNAPAEVVFGVLTDPDRVTRYLPEELRDAHEYSVNVAADELEVRWRSLTDDDLHGTARVEDAPAGGSVVHADVAAPPSIADEPHLREMLDETIHQLRRDVSDNFNAG